MAITRTRGQSPCTRSRVYQPDVAGTRRDRLAHPREACGGGHGGKSHGGESHGGRPGAGTES